MPSRILALCPGHTRSLGPFVARTCGCEAWRSRAGYAPRKVNVVLKDLWLNNSSIGDEGAVALGEALCVNASLTSINLYKNKIHQEGAVALASALKVSK